MTNEILFSLQKWEFLLSMHKQLRGSIQSHDKLESEEDLQRVRIGGMWLVLKECGPYWNNVYEKIKIQKWNRPDRNRFLKKIGWYYAWGRALFTWNTCNTVKDWWRWLEIVAIAFAQVNFACNKCNWLKQEVHVKRHSNNKGESTIQSSCEWLQHQKLTTARNEWKEKHNDYLIVK